MRRFGELFSSPDDVVRVDDVINMMLVIDDIEIRNGRYGEYAIVTASIRATGEDVKIMTSSRVLIDKIKTAKNNGWLPAEGKIIKVKNYYDIN